MEIDAVPISHAGRMVLPKRVRQELAIKWEDTFKVSVDGQSVTLTPNKSNSGFVRKGKVLVFTTPGDETLSSERVQEIIEAGRAECDS